MRGSREQQWSETAAAAAAASAMAAVANGVDINPAHVKNATPPTVGKEKERVGERGRKFELRGGDRDGRSWLHSFQGDPGRVSHEMG